MITIKSVNFEKPLSQSKPIQYLYNGAILNVENAAIAYYKDLGFKVIYTENRFWWEVFTLLFWDVIFAKIPQAVGEGYYFNDELDTFFHHNIIPNGMPMDFFEGTKFYINRKELIEIKFNELYGSDVIKLVEHSFRENFGKTARLIENWNAYTVQQITELLTALDKKIVLAILKRFVNNINEYRNGLPDLTVYDDQTAFFVEVKSENDNLSQAQIEWHDYLLKNNANVTLFVVNHTDKKIQGILNKYNPKGKTIAFSFGQSASRKYQDTVAYINSLPHYKFDSKIQRHSVEIDSNNYKEVFTLLDFTKGWKSLEIKAETNSLKSTDIRNALQCYKEKEEQNQNADWCNLYVYSELFKEYKCKEFKINPSSCYQFNKYGYLDSISEDWIIDKEKIVKDVLSEVGRLSLCPLFDEKPILKLLENIPDRVTVKNSNKFAYQDTNFDIWVFDEKSFVWKSSDGKTANKLPSITRLYPSDNSTKKSILKDNSFKATQALDVDNSKNIAINTVSRKKYKQTSRLQLAIMITVIMILVKLLS